MTSLFDEVRKRAPSVIDGIKKRASEYVESVLREGERRSKVIYTIVCPSCMHEGTVDPNGNPCGPQGNGWQVDIRSNATRCPAGHISMMVRKCPHCGHCGTFSHGLPGYGYCKRCGSCSSIWDAPCVLAAARPWWWLF
jgi:hypothetical protein